MMKPQPSLLPRVFNALAATWPAARTQPCNPFLLREGAGGGKRASCASLAGLTTPSPAQITDAERAMAALNQTPLVMIRPDLSPEETALDQALEARGYHICDPTNLYTTPLPPLTNLPLPKVSVFTAWEPLAIMEEIWEQGGITAARRAVMARVDLPKTGLFARWNDSPAGAGFVALHEGVAMVHALEILPGHRRQGLGRWMMRAAAIWAEAQGAHCLAVACTKANTGANHLYTSLGMALVGSYHYRIHPQHP